MPRISIIVPIYNVEHYLPMCIDSLRLQTLKDIEIVCVNDGSADRSDLIAKLFSEVEPRIRLVEKENGGLSSARNAGIDNARGDILVFVDADDLLVPKACETIARAFERTDADIVTFGAMPYPTFFTTAWLNKVLSPRDIDYTAFDTDILFKENSRPFAWRTAVKRSFLEAQQLRFDETLAFGEDQVFHFAAYPRAQRVSFISDKLYKYRLGRAGSLMESRYKDMYRMHSDHIIMADHIAKDWKDAGLMDAFGEDFFKWTIEFLTVGSLSHEVDDERALLTEEIVAFWNRYFDVDTMTSFVLSPEERTLVADVHSGAPDSVEVYKAHVKDYLGDTIVDIPTVHEVPSHDLLHRLLPMSSAAAAERFQRVHDHNHGLSRDLMWTAEEAAACERSLLLLQMEVQEKRRQEYRV